ncbi:hypothetical protein [uncultured Caulobacter sp.]|uniref:hypothetical protein n=1 Tax=uncultured Caulobacter sp. TaxID=158749 RepID=UPI002638AB5A|nr:hypothetical protein [uncultured Caulobacter sp.]
MSSRVFALAIAASLLFAATASAAARTDCGHRQARPASVNPKDVFRRSDWICDMPADCSLGEAHAATAMPAANPPR